MTEAETGMTYFEDGRGLNLLCSKVCSPVLCNVLQGPVWVDEHGLELEY